MSTSVPGINASILGQFASHAALGEHSKLGPLAETERVRNMISKIADGIDGEKIQEELGKLTGKENLEKLKKVAKQFESVLTEQLVKEMRSTIGDSGLLGDGASKQIQDIFWMYLSREVGEKGGIGMWQDIYRQTAQMQGLDTDNTPSMEWTR